MDMQRAKGSCCFRGRHKTVANTKRVGFDNAFTHTHPLQRIIAFRRCHLGTCQNGHTRRK